MNTTQLVGRLTKEVDLRHTNDGTAVGSFTLAVNRGFTNKDGEREADFIQCQIWRKAAENLAQFTRKGSQIGIEGRIQTRNYENQQGARVYVTEVVVNNFHLLEPKEVTEQRPQGQQQQQFTGQNGQNAGQNQQWQGRTQQQPNYQQQNNYQQPQNQSNNYMSPVEVNDDDLPF